MRLGHSAHTRSARELCGYLTSSSSSSSSSSSHCCSITLSYWHVYHSVTCLHSRIPVMRSGAVSTRQPLECRPTKTIRWPDRISLVENVEWEMQHQRHEDTEPRFV